MTILSRPPKEWLRKRPSIPGSVKLVALLRRYGPHEFDHRPPLSERSFNDQTNDTIPPANSVDHIEALTKQEHDQRTNGLRPGEKRITTAGSDANRRKKERKRQKQAERERLEARQWILDRLDRPPKHLPRPHRFAGGAHSKWPSRKIPSRLFPRKRRASKWARTPK